MKKLLFILIFLTVSNTVYANGKILKSGFIDKSSSVEEGMDVKDPKNKIIIISAIDNLIKGGAGQAVQNLNTKFNFPIKTALQ